MKAKRSPRPAGPTLEEVGLEPLATCLPRRSVAEAHELMETSGAPGVVVVHEGGVPVGVFGREKLRSPPLPPRVPWDELPVGPYAKRCRVVFAPHTPARDAVRLLHRRGLSFAPVRGPDGKLAGVVSQQALEKVTHRAATITAPTPVAQ